MTDTLLLEHISSTEFTAEKLNAIRYIIENDVNTDVKFRAMKELAKLHQKYNELVLELGIDESCLVKPTDSVSTIRKKCKKAFGHGLKMDKMRTIYAVDDSPISARLAGGSDGGMGEAQLSYSYGVSPFDGAYRQRTPEEEKETLMRRFAKNDPDSPLNSDYEEEDESVDEAKSSTERVRKYYRNNRKKVRQYLRKTSKERNKRNKDRAEAIKKYGKEKMKNHDVHHPNGVNGKWVLAPKDHGRDRKDGKIGGPDKKPVQKKPKTQTRPKTTTPPKRKTTKPYSKIKNTIDKFVTYAIDMLGITDKPEIKIVNPTNDMVSLGSFNPDTNTIQIVVKDRLPADILRTIAHELVHKRQTELGVLTNPEIDGQDGSDIENQANSVAAILMRKYGRKNKDIYVSEINKIMSNVDLLTEEENTNDEKLNLYMHTRDYTDEDLDDAVDEYFKNEETFKKFPNLAKKKEELRTKIMDAPTTVLDKEDLSRLENSDVSNVLKSTKPARELRRLETEYEKDVKGLLKAIKDETELPLPIVISHPEGIYLLGGNTRLSTLAATNSTMPVKMLSYGKVPVGYKQQTQPPRTDGGSFDSSQRKKRLEDVLQMKITNPETGNQIKVDTAMDYNKNHPAHQIALNLIRQQMAGFSSRAGIPKNKRSS